MTGIASSSPAHWLDRARGVEGPIYAAILRALELAIAEGELHPGDRLPAQRSVAERLGVDLTTVTRAYAAARDRGLLEGAVGRGTFVRARTEEDEAGLVDLGMNLPPPPAGLSLRDLLQDTIAGILQRTDPAVLMAYHPGFGTLGQRNAGAAWLAPCLGATPAERVLVSPGAQSAISAVLSAICRPGDTIVAEPLTYPGFIGVAAQLGLKVVTCPTDEEGVIPTALDEVCEHHRPSAIYLVPTMQNPTATTMGPARREAVAAAVRARGLWLIEDDPYSRLLDVPPPAVATFCPDRSFYVGTLAKALSPGLRIAYLVCPDEGEAQRVARALRASALMPAPLMAAVATTWIREGAADTLLAAVRAETRARRALAAEMLPQATGSPESLHVWLPLPSGASADGIRFAAQARGLALVTQDAFAAAPTERRGMRISLGGPGRRTVLAAALRSLAEVLGAPGEARAVV